MRLTKDQVKIITDVIYRVAGENAKVYLFGSRINDHAKGGDLDIIIEVEQHLAKIDQMRIKIKLEEALSLPVDIVVHEKNTKLKPFLKIAYSNALRLETCL